MRTARPTTHRSRPAQPLPLGSGGLPVSADRSPWHAQLSDAGMLPEQFFGPRASLGTACPEAALMRAVFENALTCFQKQFMSEGRRVQRESQEAEEWFMSNDSHWLFSFVSVCMVLGLEPEAVRQGLKRWSQSYPKTLQRKRKRVPAVRQSPGLAA
jgi:hypothetical protein